MTKNIEGPNVSIIIPHFNRARLLAETIESVRRQSYAAWEVIVVDDGSDDQEWLAIQPLADERIRIEKRSDGIKGPSRCRNLGVAEARGNYLIFLDSDDLLAPWCLAERVRQADDHPGHDLWIFPVMLFEQTPGDLSACWNRLEGEYDLERFLHSDPPWHTSSPLWRRDAFNRIGGFNEVVMYGDDADLHIRALLLGVDYGKYPERLPDIFIRRSNAPRITGSWSRSLLASRLVRLQEGTKTLRQFNASLESCRIWEGQYFVESEELLFHIEQPGAEISNIIHLWISQYQPSLFHKLVARAYFTVALLCKKNAYFILRIARRLAMKILPASFSPRDGFYNCWKLSTDEVELVRQRLCPTQMKAEH